MIIKTMVIFIGIPGLFGVMLLLRRKFHSTIFKKTLMFMLIGLYYLIIISGIYGFLDTNIIKQMSLGLIILFAAQWFVLIYRKLYNNNYITRLLWDLYFAGILHSLFIILNFLSPDFRSFIYQWINISDRAAINLNIRAQGIVYSGFSILSTGLAFMLIAGIVVYYGKKKSHKLYNVILFNFSLLLNFVAIALVARSGLVVAMLGVSCYLFWQIHKKKKHQYIYITTLKMLIVMSLFITIGSLYLDLSAYENQIQFAFNPFINILTHGYSSVRIFQDLSASHYFLPDNILDLFFGTSNFGRSENLPYISSDVGYVTFIFGAGIVGLMLGYSFYIIIMYYALLKHRLDSKLRFLLVFYVISILIVNFKDFYFIGFSGYSQIFFLITCAYAEYHRTLLYSNTNLSSEKITARF